MIPVAHMGTKIPFEKNGDWELYDEIRYNILIPVPAVPLFNFDEDDIGKELGFG